MKKQTLLSIILLLVIFTGRSVAQTTYNTVIPETEFVTGTVKDANGNFLRYAFVQDKKNKTAVYTDSVGSFVLKTSPKSILYVNCSGFRDTAVKVGTLTSFVIVLKPVSGASAEMANATSTSNTTLLQHQLSDQINANSQAHYNTIIQQGSLLPMIHVKEETQGTEYLFKNWVRGYVVNVQDSIIQNPAFLLNYDKITGSLLLTQDNKTVIEIDKDRVKSFTLFDALNQPYTFAMAPSIDQTHFLQVLADGRNYKIYKLTKTKFVESNYKSDGIASTGNNYDEYRDDFEYYVLNVKTNTVQKTSLKKKALKQAFDAADQNKVADFLQANSGDIDDNYLASLGDNMNK
jgi:hypothetical protein